MKYINYLYLSPVAVVFGLVLAGFVVTIEAASCNTFKTCIWSTPVEQINDRTS